MEFFSLKAKIRHLDFNIPPSVEKVLKEKKVLNKKLIEFTTRNQSFFVILPTIFIQTKLPNFSAIKWL